MAWQGQQLLSVGNGNGNGDGNSQASQPQGTEYTLQGVMRFLQMEWHRHERDRNAWEIERQEMRVRIASLEGSGRRADSQTKGLRKYVNMLEKTLATERRKNRSGQTNGVAAETEAGDKMEEETEKKENKKRPSLDDKMPHNSFLATGPSSFSKPSNEDDDPARLHLKTFLEGMAGEFTYLMVSGAHPAPPRDSAHSNTENVGEAQGRDYNLAERQRIEDQYIPKQQQMDLARLMQEDDRQAMLERERSAMAAAQALRHQREQREQPQAAPMQRQEPQRQSQPPPNYWAENQKPQQSQPQMQQQQQPQEEEVSQVNHVFDTYGRELQSSEIEERKVGVRETETDDWDFGDAEIKPMPIVVTSRGDTDAFPTAKVEVPAPKSPGRNAQRRRSSASRRQSESEALEKMKKDKDDGQFKVRFGLRGHLDVVRAVVFTGGGSPGEPELATAGDDGVIKRWIIPSRYSIPGAENGQAQRDDMDIPPSFTHRGHSGSVLCLTAWHPSIQQAFAPGAPRPQGEGWIFSGGQDSSIRVWERARVDPKATLEGHTDAVWAVCVLPTTCGQVFGTNSQYGSPERILLVSGSADATVKVWSVSAPPSLPNPTGSAGRRGGRQRGNSTSSGSNFPGTPQPSIASNTPFTYTLIHSLTREGSDASPTSIVPLGPGGESFCVSYNDAAVLVFDTRTGEELSSMASTETYDGTVGAAVNAIVATTSGLDSSLTFDASRGSTEEMDAVSGATGSSRGVEGTIITGHEDCFIRFFDANSGQCTYNMLAHPSSISNLSLSPDGRELVSAGHDASLRFWSLEKRTCVAEIQGARVMRGEGVCSVEWSQDGRTVVGGGGDGVVKVFCR